MSRFSEIFHEKHNTEDDQSNPEYRCPGPGAVDLLSKARIQYILVSFTAFLDYSKSKNFPQPMCTCYMHDYKPN